MPIDKFTYTNNYFPDLPARIERVDGKLYWYLSETGELKDAVVQRELGPANHKSGALRKAYDATFDAIIFCIAEHMHARGFPLGHFDTEFPGNKSLKDFISHRSISLRDFLELLNKNIVPHIPKKEAGKLIEEWEDYSTIHAVNFDRDAIKSFIDEVVVKAENVPLMRMNKNQMLVTTGTVLDNLEFLRTKVSDSTLNRVTRDFKEGLKKWEKALDKKDHPPEKVTHVKGDGYEVETYKVVAERQLAAARKQIAQSFIELEKFTGSQQGSDYHLIFKHTMLAMKRTIAHDFEITDKYLEAARGNRR